MKPGTERKWDIALWVLSTTFIFVTIAFHQPWRDEGQAVMLAQDATGFWDLIQRIKWEGHPLLWFVLAKVSGPTLTPYIHGVLAVSTNALIVFKSNWPKFLKWVLPFTYFFAFEYAIVFRDYAVGIFLLFSAITLWKKKPNWAFLLLLIATQANFFSLVLACGLGFLMLLNDPRNKAWIWRIPLTIAILAFTVYQLTPPETGGFASGWNFDSDKLSQALSIFDSSVILPVFLAQHEPLGGLIFIHPSINAIIALALLTFMIMTLRTSSYRMVFGVVSTIILAFCSIKLFGFARHIGHIWIFYLLLLYAESRDGIKIQPYLFLKLLLTGQLIGGIGHLALEYIYPYSESTEMANYLEAQVPSERTAVFPASYGAGLSFETGKSYYQPDMDTTMTHIIWNPESQVDYYPKQILTRLYSHFNNGEVFLVTPINMTQENVRYENPWKNILQPVEIETGSRPGFAESFHLYKIDLDSLTQP